jgi:predicted DNA-binding transcriptional regulator YafY
MRQIQSHKNDRIESMGIGEREGRNQMDTTYRHWLMLQMIPRHPRKIDGAAIEARLRDEGYETTRRTIQRDLMMLANVFPLICDGKSKPFGWSWSSDAPGLTVPNMDPAAALTFRMVEQHLAPLLPRSAFRSIEPYLSRAGRVLDRLSENRLRAWPQKVRVVPRGQPLRAPEVKEEVLETVCTALLEECRLCARYRKRGESEAKEYEVSPLGLVFQDRIIYLVATLWDYKDPILLLLHRFESAELLEKPCTPPVGFDLEAYSERELHFPEGEQPLRLEALFNAGVAMHLAETPLSDDQQMTEKADGRVLVKATIADTAQLRWWLLGFGDRVEVRKPKRLREEFRAISRRLCEQYDGKGA